MPTCGEFLDGVLEMDFGESRFYVKDLIASVTQEKLKVYRERPLARQDVLLFAREMSGLIYERLSGICTDALYTRTYNDGHAFIRAINDFATKLGIEMKVTDSPITPTDIAVNFGLVGLDDRGNVFPKV